MLEWDHMKGQFLEHSPCGIGAMSFR